MPPTGQLSSVAVATELLSSVAVAKEVTELLSSVAVAEEVTELLSSVAVAEEVQCSYYTYTIYLHVCLWYGFGWRVICC